jgi:xanthine dehydrogenase YagR molybdenum-binding subunit
MIGKPLPRPDGVEKVTGRAQYTADNSAPDLLHAVLVTASIPAGRVTSIGIDEAMREAGVESVLTHQDMPKFGRMGGPPTAQSFMPMQSGQIRYEGQPVAIVLASTLEAAEAGARKVLVHYKRGKTRLPAPPDWTTLDAIAVDPKKSDFLFFEPEFAKADADKELARSAIGSRLSTFNLRGITMRWSLRRFLPNGTVTC